MKRSIALFLLLLTLTISMAGCGSTNDAEASTSDGAISTSLENKGSDTMVNLALYWAERYQNGHPDVRISVTGGGSGTGITALISNTVDIANASRAIKDEEMELAHENGVEPVEQVVARDAIAVIVNPQNPIQQLTLQQVSDLYTRKITNWKELGGEDRPVVLLSRETNSGTHVYFLESVIRLGNKEDETIFSAETLLLPSSEGIIAEVRDNPNAIGYDGLGYITPEVKVIALSVKEGAEYVMPTVETVNDNRYPVARDLYMYTNGEPEGFIKTYIEWILSSEGQEIVEELGFVPVNQE